MFADTTDGISPNEQVTNYVNLTCKNKKRTHFKCIFIHFIIVFIITIWGFSPKCYLPKDRGFFICVKCKLLKFTMLIQL